MHIKSSPHWMGVPHCWAKGSLRLGRVKRKKTQVIFPSLLPKLPGQDSNLDKESQNQFERFSASCEKHWVFCPFHSMQRTCVHLPLVAIRHCLSALGSIWRAFVPLLFRAPFGFRLRFQARRIRHRLPVQGHVMLHHGVDVAAISDSGFPAVHICASQAAVNACEADANGLPTIPFEVFLACNK
jgi:hypothetical protein